jgi:hypothetical protein
MPKRDNKPENKAPSKPKRVNTKARQLRHAHRIEAAARRRSSLEFQIPPNAMVELKSLPGKARDKAVEELIASGVHVNADFTTGPEDKKEPIMVPDPRRGLKVKGRQLQDALARRHAQTQKIHAKREQRRRFASLSPGQKIDHREAGRTHTKPRDMR